MWSEDWNKLARSGPHVPISILHAGAFRSRRCWPSRGRAQCMPQSQPGYGWEMLGPRQGRPKQLSLDSICILKQESIPALSQEMAGAHLHIILLSFTCCLQYWLYQALGVQTQEPWACIHLVCKGVRAIQRKSNPPVIGEGPNTNPSGCSRSHGSSERGSPLRLPGRGRI